MPGPTTPHTETGQNQGFEASDFEGRASMNTPARGEDALDAGNEGAQTACAQRAARLASGGGNYRG